MSYIVRGAEIPKSCYECVLTKTYFRDLKCNELDGMSGFVGKVPHTEDRHPNCPLEEVRTAHWIKIDERTGKCSNCGHLQYTNGYDQTKGTVILNAIYPYCPHCGAGREE